MITAIVVSFTYGKQIRNMDDEYVVMALMAKSVLDWIGNK